MNFSKLFIKRPVTTIMVVFVVVLVGLVSLLGLPMDLLPNIELPVAIVYTQYGSASPEEIESMVTVPLEQALASVENLDSITSMTMSGASIVMVQFDMDTDMNFATLDMREKVDMIKGYLPEDAAEPMVMKMSMDFAPTAQVYVSGEMGLAELNEEIENNILSRLERAGGVASASVYGGVSEEVTLNFDQEKLSGYGLTLSAVNQILAAENLNMPSGEISKGDTKVVVRTMGQFNSVDEIRNIPMAMADGSIVRLQELANIEMGYTEQEAISRVDGASAIGISLSKQSSANTVEVSDAILAELDELRADYPELNFVMGFDQADYIRSSISSVAQSALAGAILAIVVLFLFLRNLSATLVIAISIPTSILATFALMNLMGMTLNLITLCALTLAVGMLVDNSVVVLENIVRVSKEHKLGAMEASMLGSKQIVLAVMASTLTSVVVYLPIALSEGIASMLFRDFCWTIIVALVASLIVSLSVVPMLTSKMLNTGASDQYLRIGNRRYRYKLVNKFGSFIEKLTAGYGNVISSFLKIRKRVIAICLVFFVVSVALLGVVGMEFLPASDEGSFTVSMDTPYGTSLKTKEAMLSEVEAYVLGIPEVEHCTLDIGQTSALIGGNSSSLSVTLVPRQNRDRSTAEVAEEVRNAFTGIAGADLTVSEASSMTAMMGGADIALSVKGPDLETLRQITDDLALQIGELSSIDTVSTGYTEGNPELRVKLDRTTASYYGVTAYQLANSLQSALTGSASTSLKMDGVETDITLSLSDTYSQSIDNMKQIMIPTATGQLVPVGQLAELEYGNSPSQIDRLDQQRYITINCDIIGSNLADASTEVMALVDSYNFPDGYSYSTGGMNEEMIDAFKTMLLALIVAILLVYMVLAAQFESLVLPLMVMMAIPFSMSGAFLGLVLTGKTLSATSFIGLIMLVGIVVNNSILLIEFIVQNREEMGRDKAIVEAGKMRLRPILITTITTCVGMIPMALGLGDGGEMLAPMAISIIGGLVGSTLVTLLMIPVLYAAIDDKRLKRFARKAQRREFLAELEAGWRKEDESHDIGKGC